VDANQNVLGTGKSLEWNGNVDDPNAKVIRLRDRLNEADTERRKAEEAALARERAGEIRREERLKKIAYMTNMPDNTPAGTGTYCFEGMHTSQCSHYYCCFSEWLTSALDYLRPRFYCLSL
jgi:hypothetical protein